MVRKRGFRFMLISASLALLFAISTSVVLAGTTWFNVIVPKFGGCANTNLTTKYTTTNRWEFYDLRTGGDKLLRFRPMKNGRAVGNFYLGKTGWHVWGPYTTSVNPGDGIYGQICTRWYEPVNVQAWGTFDSN